MNRSQKTRVKVCCIGSIGEAWQAIDFGASAIGLVGEMPSGPGVITDDVIATIASVCPPGVASFLLTSFTKADRIIAHHQLTHTNTIQIVDEIPAEAFDQIRTALPGVKLVQVIHVVDEASIEQAQQMAQYADAILLDSGNPSLEVKELGGTGRRHDWKVSRQIVESIQKPVYLAGGLNAGNIQEAIETVQPFGVDLCSGVRTAGKLDPVKLEQFFNAIEKIGNQYKN